MSEEGSALDARKPFRAQAAVSFDGFSGREQHGDVLVYPKGLLLRTRYLKPVGTGVEFEVDVEAEAGRTETLRGRGLVVFSRWQDQGQRRPAGLGVRIEQLDEASRAGLQRLFPPAPPLPPLEQSERLDDGREEEPAATLIPELPLQSALETEDDGEVSRHAFPPEISPTRSTPAWMGEPAATAESAERLETIEPEDGASEPPPIGPNTPIATTVGGWRDAPALSVEGPYVTTSRRWLEDTGHRIDRPDEPPAEQGSAAGLRPEDVAWPEGPEGPEGDPPSEAPRLEFAAHAQARADRPRLLPWVLVGAFAVLVIAAGYWAYSRFLAAEPEAAGAAATPSAPAPSTSPPQRLPAAAPGSTLLDDVRASAGPGAAAPTPPAGSEGGGEPAAPDPPAAAVTPVAANPVNPPRAPAAAGAEFSKLTDIRWESVGPGGLRVTLQVDGTIGAGRVSRARLDDPPREVIRLRAPIRPFTKGRIEVGEPLLERVRVGLQPNGDLQIVLDLGDAAVRAAAPRLEGDRIEVLLSR